MEKSTALIVVMKKIVLSVKTNVKRRIRKLFQKRFIKIKYYIWFIFIIKSMKVGDLASLGESAVFLGMEEWKWKPEDVILQNQAMAERISVENQ